MPFWNLKHSLEEYHIEIIISIQDEDCEDEMVRCCNPSCELGCWFHLKCVDLDHKPGIFEEWYCSDECSASGNSCFCTCNMKKEEEMIPCINGGDCAHGIQFHRSCINSQENLGMDPFTFRY